MPEATSRPQAGRAFSTLPSPLYGLYAERDHLSPLTITLVYAAYAAGVVVSLIFAGHLSDKMGRRQVIVSSLGMTAVVLLFMAFAGHSTAFVFFVAVLGFFLFAIRAVLQAWLLDATPREMAGTSVGLMFGMSALGAAIGPVTAGMIADRYGLSATFYFLAITIVLANVFMFFTPMPDREPRKASSATPAVS